MAVDYAKISQTLDKLLKGVDLSSTTEEGVKYELPDGYYLCEVKNAELTESKSGNPMVTIEFSTIEDGKKIIIDDEGYSQLTDAKGTTGKKIYQNYVLGNDMQIGFFVSDMLKFQDPETDMSFFTKEDFLDTKGIINVCSTLTAGGIIYIMVQTVEKRNAPGENEKKYKPISWKRARKLDLI